MKSIPFYSTEKMPKTLKRDFMKQIRKTLDHDSLIEGRACGEFESLFGQYLGGLTVVGVGNGYDALYSLLLALDLPPGSRVGVPVHTFCATWLSIVNAGHSPIGFDIDEYGNLDPNVLPKDTNENIKVLIVVHMHGNPAQMSKIVDWCTKNSTILIEDCAQAAGLKISGKSAGSFGIASIFSFYPTKNLFAIGDGGAVATSDSRLAEEVRRITRYGTFSDKSGRRLPAVNSRLDSIQAAVLQVGLRYLDDWNHQRQENARAYTSHLGDLLNTNGSLGNLSVYHHYTVLIENRNRFMEQMQSRKISLAVHYLHLAGDGICSFTGNFPNALDYVNRVTSLPISPWQTIRTTNKVVEAVLSSLRLNKLS